VSHTPIGSSSLSPDDEYLQAWKQLARLIQQGRSFSGRERNCCFLNTRGPRFADVSAATGLDFADDGRGLAVTDWDHDGDLDLWLTNRTSPRVRFVRNDVPGGDWISLELVGDAALGANRDAIGARVEIELDELNGATPRRLVKTVTAGDGYLSQSSKALHFGLGDGADGTKLKIAQVRVHWPTAGETKTETFTGIQPGRRYRIAQGSGRAAPISTAPRNVALRPSEIAAAPLSAVGRVKLLEPLPIGAGEFRDLDGRTHRLGDFVGAPLLLNFWSTSCAPCVKELRELSAERATFERLRVRIVALNVDAIKPDPPTADAIKSSLVSLGYAFDSGVANQELLGVVDAFQRRVVYRQRTLPLPMSVLVDPAGRGWAVYFGPVKPEQLLADILAMTAAPSAYRDQAVPFAGRWARDVFQSHPIAVAAAYMESGYADDARDYVAKFLEAETAPPSTGGTREELYRNLRVADMHHTLGRIAAVEGKHEAAAAAYRKALAYHAEHAAARVDLAWLLSTCAADAVRDGAEAVRLAEPLARRAARDDYLLRDTLAAAYAEAGRFDEAAAAAKLAVEAATEQGRESLAEAIAKRAEVYASGRAYRAAKTLWGVRE
jgi:tetratricopeptide (TPR) repeat protein